MFAPGAAGVPASAAGSGRGGGGVARGQRRGSGGPVTDRPRRRSEPAWLDEGGRLAEGEGATLLHTHSPSSLRVRGLRIAEGTGSPGRGGLSEKSLPQRPDSH